jgi:hypothetical protein
VLDPAWRVLGALLVLPTVGLIASGNLLYLGDLESADGLAWAACQVLALAGAVVGIRAFADGGWRGAAVVLALAWVAAHVAYDLVLTDSFVRFGERVEIPRPWVFGDAVVLGAWLAGLATVRGGLAATRAWRRAMAFGPATRRFALVGLAAMLRGR